MDVSQYGFMTPYQSFGYAPQQQSYGFGSPYQQNSFAGNNQAMGAYQAGGMGMMPMSQIANPYAFGTGYGMPMGNPYSMMGYGQFQMAANPYSQGSMGYNQANGMGGGSMNSLMGNPYAQNSFSYNQAQGNPYGPQFLQNLINAAPQQQQPVDPWGVNQAQPASPYQSAGVGSLAQRGITPAQPQAQPAASPYQTMGVGSLSQRLG